MNEWLRQWWPILAVLLFLVVALGWFVQRMVKSSSAGGAANAFETVFRKEMVQPIITHIMAWTFAVLAASMIITFLATRQFDRAEDVFAYIVAVIGPIVGFWFGSRAGEGKDKGGDSGNKGPPNSE